MMSGAGSERRSKFSQRTLGCSFLHTTRRCPFNTMASSKQTELRSLKDEWISFIKFYQRKGGYISSYTANLDFQNLLFFKLLFYFLKPWLLKALFCGKHQHRVMVMVTMITILTGTQVHFGNLLIYVGWFPVKHRPGPSEAGSLGEGW